MTPLNTFEFVTNTSDRIMYETALTAITQLELWDFMKNFSGESFMYSNQPEIRQIYEKIEQLGYNGHSGASFGFTLRTMQYIATHSLEEFRICYIANNQNQSQTQTQTQTQLQTPQ
jgi:hypothetical protein